MLLAILGQIDEPSIDADSWRPLPELFSIKCDCTCRLMSQAEKGFGKLCSPRANNAGKPEDLATADLKTDVLKPFATQSGYGKARCIRLVCDALLSIP